MFLTKKLFIMKQNLKTKLKNKLTKEQLNLLPRSFDVVGDIVIFSDFPKELKNKEKLISEYLIEIHKNINVVAKKTKKYSGRYRTPKLKILAGDKRKTTTHKENKTKAKLNVETCYFSPRLSNERLRIAKLVKKNESVLVMFSGVAIYPLVIAKNSKAKEIYAIEINPVAHKYALENVKINKIDNIKLFKGNVKSVLPKINKKFDRIVMPHPTNAEAYLDLATKKLKTRGTIHLYYFSKCETKYKHFKNLKIMKAVKCGQYSPRKYRICLDLKLSDRSP